MTGISLIHSAVESIDLLRVYPIPTKPIKDAKVVRVDRTVVMMDGAGRLYSTQVTGRFSFGSADNRESLRNTITGAYKLGAISRAAMDEDLRQREEKAKRHFLRQSAEHITSLAATVGIKFTDAQKRRIEAAAAQEAV